jgi:hypothetical protein
LKLREQQHIAFVVLPLHKSIKRDAKHVSILVTSPTANTPSFLAFYAFLRVFTLFLRLLWLFATQPKEIAQPISENKLNSTLFAGAIFTVVLPQRNFCGDFWDWCFVVQFL